MNIIGSKNVSLLCAVLNGMLFINCALSADWLFSVITLGFCALCTRNYLHALREDT